MKVLSSDAIAAMTDGTAISVGAVKIDSGPSAVGPIDAASVGAGGSGYAIGDTGAIAAFSADATYTVLTVDGGGAVLTFSFTPGTAYKVATNRATSVTTGAGDGAFAVNIDAIVGATGGPSTILPRASTAWKYLLEADTTTGSDYSATGFDDSAWSTGTSPFYKGWPHPSAEITGWGSHNTAIPDDSNVWMRQTITATVGHQLSITVKRDDFARLWINGEEVTLTASGSWTKTATIIAPSSTLQVTLQVRDGTASGSGNCIFADMEIIATPPFAGVRVWGGYGTIALDGEDYLGIGDRGLVTVTGAAIGDSEQNVTLTLSGIEPAVLSLLDATELQRSPCKIWLLTFDGSGTQMLDAHTYMTGQIDAVTVDETIGGTATIVCEVETAARGMGRSGQRMRTDADQRLIDSSDGGFRVVSFAGRKTLYWGGHMPSSATI